MDGIECEWYVNGLRSEGAPGTGSAATKDTRKKRVAKARKCIVGRPFQTEFVTDESGQ